MYTFLNYLIKAFIKQHLFVSCQNPFLLNDLCVFKRPWVWTFCFKSSIFVLSMQLIFVFISCLIVCAEAFNPDEDEEDKEPRVNYFFTFIMSGLELVVCNCVDQLRTTLHECV